MFKKQKEIIDLLKKTILAALLAAASPAHALEFGVATYYTNPSHPGLIAAHKSLPFGTRVKVTDLDNGRAVVVTIVDRGPYARGRIIDLSTTAAARLGILSLGVAHVRVDRL
jgi:rare lipoprotein A